MSKTEISDAMTQQCRRQTVHQTTALLSWGKVIKRKPLTQSELLKRIHSPCVIVTFYLIVCSAAQCMDEPAAAVSVSTTKPSVFQNRFVLHEP